MRVLVAIKEEFAIKIFDGSKRFEFRKSIFKDQRVKTVVVYVSSPVKQVIGEFSIDSIIKDDPENLWRRTKKYSGITKNFFNQYFAEKKYAYAITIKNAKKYNTPKYLKQDFNINFAPQSYVYLDKR